MPPKPKKTNQNIPSNADATLELLKWLEQHKQDDKEDRRLMYKSINEHGLAISKMLPMLEACWKDINGNGQPGLKKTVDRHASIQKWLCRVAIAVIGSGTTLIAVNWNTLLSKIYILMQILEWWNKNHQ